MKSFLSQTLALLSGYVGFVLACWAESGPQVMMVPGYKSNSDYSALGATRYVFVMHTAANRANLATNATSSTILGVMQNNPKVDQAMSITAIGRSKITAGGQIAAGAIITTNASGRAAAVASGQMACGRLLEASGADGDVVSAMLFHPVRWAGAA